MVERVLRQGGAVSGDEDVDAAERRHRLVEAAGELVAVGEVAHDR